MKLIFKIIFVFCVFNSNLNAQTYFNNNYEYNLKVANASTIIEVDSGYIFPSCIYTSAYGSLLIMKIGANGDTIWTKEFRDSLHSYSTGSSNSIIKTSDNNYVFCGSRIDDFGNRDAMLVKINIYGDTLWTKTYGGANFDNANVVCQTPDSGFVLMGVTKSFSTGAASDFYLIKTDKNGNQQWQQNYGTTLAEDCFSGQITLDGGYIMSGIKNSLLYVLKTDVNGNFQWHKQLTGTAGTAFVKQLIDSTYLIVGAKLVSGFSYQAYMAKLNSTGSTINWEKTYGGVEDDQFYTQPVILSDGSIVIGGQSMLGSSPIGLLIKTDIIGNQQWLRTYYKNSSSDNYIYDLKTTSDNGFIMSGFCFVATSDPWAVKTDEFGCEVSNCNVGVNDYSKENSVMNIFPNPVTNELNIELFNNDVSEYNLSITNVLGELQNVKANHSVVDVSPLAPGIYFITATSKDGNKRFTEKFVKE